MAHVSKRPSCLFECYDAERGRVDPYKYFKFKQGQDDELGTNEYLTIIAACEMIAKEEMVMEQNASCHLSKRRKKCLSQPREQRMYRDEIDGTIKYFGPRETAWYQNYVSNPPLHSKKFRSKFRRRFRCKYEYFQKHLKEVQQSPMFKKWGGDARDAVGNKSSPIELLLLGALRYLGRGWCFDDLEEQTCICEEVHRTFVHVYLIWGSTTFYGKQVVMPVNGEEAKQWATEYEMAGFPGCVSSGDATHVGMLKCMYYLRQFNESFKLNMPSRTYNTHVTHRRKIIYSTSGHPGRWNDQSLQLFDEYANEMRNGKKYDDLSFTLLERSDDKSSSINKVQYRGAWEIVDNGYLPWPTMIPPSKLYSTYAEMRFSKWLESLRKDVECCFGIMKGRFRILKTGIPLHGIDVCDNVWRTCCALHNFLLEEDELDSEWNASRYLFEEGWHDEVDVCTFLGASSCQDVLRGRFHYDCSGMGPGTDVPDMSIALSVMEEDDGLDNDYDNDMDSNSSSDAIPLYRMRMDQFRGKLIEHFDILWEQRKIKWPSRTGSNAPANVLEHCA